MYQLNMAEKNPIFYLKILLFTGWIYQKKSLKNYLTFLVNIWEKKNLPGYDALLSENMDCYPSNLQICEDKLETNIYDVIYYKITRIFERFADKIFENCSNLEFEFRFKYGNNI